MGEGGKLLRGEGGGEMRKRFERGGRGLGFESEMQKGNERGRGKVFGESREGEEG